MSDNTGAVIPKTKFENVVKQYQNSGCFVVNINKRQTEKRKSGSLDKSVAVNVDAEDGYQPLDDIISDEEAANIVEDLKMTLVSIENIDVIKESLLKTLQYRSKLLAKEELNLREYFPYFFTNPELVCNSLHLKH